MLEGESGHLGLGWDGVSQKTWQKAEAGVLALGEEPHRISPAGWELWG